MFTEKAHPVRFIAALAAILLLSACAEQWQKPGSGESDFEIMKARCMSRAAQRFPPLLHNELMGTGYTDPLRTSCTDRGPTTNCVVKGGTYHPPSVVTVDENQDLRNQDQRACFFENGWTPVKD